MQVFFPFSPKTDQVNYFPLEGKNGLDPTFLTISKCKLEFWGLYQTGPVLVKKHGPKI
jgi:hypothetical protein